MPLPLRLWPFLPDYAQFFDLADNEKHSVLESLADEFIPGDYAFLTDSWEDIIFAFAIPENATQNELVKHEQIYARLGFIYDLQNALYEDFLVDRTELMLSAECINAIANDVNKNGANYKLNYRMRMGKDRHLIRSNNKLIANIQEKAKGKGLKVISLTRIPGRMDFAVELDLSTYQGDNLVQDLLSLGDSQKDNIILVDRTDISIGKVEHLNPKNKD